jgi:hypothetical protein
MRVNDMSQLAADLHVFLNSSPEGRKHDLLYWHERRAYYDALIKATAAIQ